MFKKEYDWRQVSENIDFHFLSIKSHTLVAAMRDRASVNNLAMRTLALIYLNVLDIGCFSHTIDHVGCPTIN